VRGSTFAILRALASGRTLSAGELLAKAGCEAADIASAIRELEAEDIEVHASDAGLRLAAPFDALDAEAISDGLGSVAGRIRVELVDECDSTSDRAAARARAGAASGTAVVCELQRAGRGRQGAQWYSGLGTSLTFSLLWRFESKAGLLTGLPLVVGVACARALESLGARDVALKWPNDLLRGVAKLGGVLVEAQGDARGPMVAIVGIGINVRIPDAARRAISRPVADLGGVSYGSRNAAAARLFAALDEALAAFARTGFAAFREEWQRRHAFQGARVQLLVPSERPVVGIAAGIGEDGALLLDTATGVKRFYAGEVSLRAA
jgi:BirA family biotin operon repressor/biotin-[acetyl-CoA-carboxylase] ligase